MRLFVINPKTSERIYLKKLASTRQQLAELIGSEIFDINGVLYTIKNVVAEKESNKTATGMALGGVVGLLGGTPGVIIGGIIGGFIGKSSDETEEEKVRIFNGASHEK